MLSHLEYPEDIKSELEAEISDALDTAEARAEEAIADLEEKLEEYRDISSHVDDMRALF